MQIKDYVKPELLVVMFCFLPFGQSIYTLPMQALTVPKKFFMFRMFSFTTLRSPPVNCCFTLQISL